jgi:transcriptional regulator with XRE-family HTH domain
MGARVAGVGSTGRRDRPHEVDVHVGQRLRMRRTLLGLSQGELARSVGLTFQQIQKYERGANRIGASRLAEFAIALDVPPGWFFEELPGLPTKPKRGSRAESSAIRELGGRETLDVVRLFNKVKDRRVRERVMALLRAVAAVDEQIGG